MVIFHSYVSLPEGLLDVDTVAAKWQTSTQTQSFLSWSVEDGINYDLERPVPKLCWRWNHDMKIYDNLVSMLGGCGKPQFADLPGTRSMAGQACTAELRGLLLVAPVHVSWQGKSTWWILRDTQLWQHRWFAWLWNGALYYHILPINELVLLAALIDSFQNQFVS